MLENLKSKIKEIEENKKIKKEQKEKIKKEKIELWNKEQDELAEIIDGYYTKLEGFLELIKIANFETLYNIYNDDNEYTEYFEIYDMLNELYTYNYARHEGGIDNRHLFNGEHDRLRRRIENSYDVKLMQRFLKDPYRFKNLITPYKKLGKNIYYTVYDQFKKNLQDVFWNSYDTNQVKKIKLFYDLFLEESQTDSFSFSISENGSGSGTINYKEKQSIYEFVFCDIEYCRELDKIDNK
jgi:hypothetical protein